MGKACKPPTQTHKRKFWITEHAVSQLRERFTREGITHRDQEDLGNLIDSATRRAVVAGEAEDVIDDDGAAATLVDLRNTLHDQLWALIKNNTGRKKDTYPRAVVTLLEHWQVIRSKKSGKWGSPHITKHIRIGGLPDKAKKSLQKLRESLPGEDHEDSKTISRTLVRNP